MSVLTTGLWKAPQNTKIPALSHWLSLKGTFTTTAAAGTVTLSLPANYLSPGQLAPITGTPSSFAPTSSPADPNSEPQTGLRLIIQKMVVRDISANAVAGSSAGGTVQLQSNVSGSFANTPLVATLPTTGNSAQIVIADMGGTLGAGTPVAGSQNLVLVPGTTVQFVVTAGTAQTAGLSAALTIDLFAHWLPAV